MMVLKLKSILAFVLWIEWF